MLAAAEMVCSQCGNLRSVCSDPAVDWHPQESVCWASATQQWGIRRLRIKHKDFDPDALDDRGEPLMDPRDGVSVWVSDIDIEAMSQASSDEVHEDGHAEHEGDLPQGG